MKTTRRRRQYTVPFKIKVVEEYLNTNTTKPELMEKYYISSQSVFNWTKLYEEGFLRMENTVSVSNRTKQQKTMVINGEVYEEYTKPKHTININGVDYVKRA